MWKAKVEVTLVSDAGSDAGSEEAVRFEIEEEIPGGLKSIDPWEGDVRRLGFRTMRKMFELGIKRLEADVLPGYLHRNPSCKVVRRGMVGFGIGTVFGKVRFQRQRMYCETCGKWMTPLNDVLGLHEKEKGRCTLGLKELVCLCVVNQAYEPAQRMVGQVTQDPDVISARQMESIADGEGAQIRRIEEQERKQVSFDVIRQIQDRKGQAQAQAGKLYVCLDGILVRSNEGKGRLVEAPGRLALRAGLRGGGRNRRTTRRLG